MEKDTAFVPLWRNRDYMLLWSGQLVSVTGNRIAAISFPLLILTLTGSPAQAGLLGVISSLPYIVLSLPAGALTDRWNRKRVMILCDSARTLALGTIPLAIALGRLTLLQLYVVAGIEGSLMVFFDLSQVAAIPRVVPRRQLPAAQAQNTIMYTTSSLVGPPLGGALYQVSRALPFLADAVSYGASVISLFFIRTEFQRERVRSHARLRQAIAEGLSWLWERPLIRFLAFLAFGANVAFLSGGTYLLIIVLARRMGAAPSLMGTILAIGAVGGLAGALLVSRVQARFGFGAVMIGTTWLLTLCFPLYLAVPSPILLGAVNALLSMLMTIYNVTQMSYRIALIPDELQGRVNSVFRLIAFAGQPIGAGLIGLSLQFLGPISTVAAITACLLLMAIATTVNRAVRDAPPIGEVVAA